MRTISNEELYVAIEAVANWMGPNCTTQMHMAIAAIQMEERAKSDRMERDMAISNASLRSEAEAKIAMEDALWKLIDIAEAFPGIWPGGRVWWHVMAYMPIEKRAEIVKFWGGEI